MRFCLIPSTICSICLRNCSLALEEDIALKQIHIQKVLLPECETALDGPPWGGVKTKQYSLLEVVMNGVQQIHLQKKQNTEVRQCGNGELVQVISIHGL